MVVGFRPATLLLSLMYNSSTLYLGFRLSEFTPFVCHGDVQLSLCDELRQRYWKQRLKYLLTGLSRIVFLRRIFFPSLLDFCSLIVMTIQVNSNTIEDNSTTIVLIRLLNVKSSCSVI